MSAATLAAEEGRPVALILAGGRGTRFWPLSRSARPKQLLALDREESLLRCTVERLAPLVAAEDVWVCTTEPLVESVVRDLPEVAPEQILAEPEGRNTAPAIAWAIRSMPPETRRRPVIVLPADHRIGDEAAFRQALESATHHAATEDRVLTLGVRPRWAETGYGYLQVATSPDSVSVARVLRFTEKPDRPTAERFLASGDYLWNAGIFVFRGNTLLRLVAEHIPELAAGLEEIAAAPERLGELYPRLPRVSIDYGVMEQLEEISTVPLDCGWSDLGSWQALLDLLAADAGDDVGRGDVVRHDTRGNLLWAESGTIAAVGVENLVIVRTEDAVLVVPRERSQEVRKVVDLLAERGREDLL